MKKNKTVQKALGELKHIISQTELSEVIVGVSGGADSLALAATMSIYLRGSALMKRAKCVTVDHGLQINSAQIAANTKQQCENLGFSSEVLEANLENGANLEERARDRRYQLLTSSFTVRENADTFSKRAVLVAHTLNDQAENVILGLIRGSGLSALHGMNARISFSESFPPVQIIRPFLNLTRDETEEICQVFGLTWYNDPTNYVPNDAQYGKNQQMFEQQVYAYPLRSKVRTQIIPKLEELAPGIQKNLARTAHIARLDDDYLWEEANCQLKEVVDAHDGLTIQIGKLRKIPLALRLRILALWLNHPPFDRVEEINQKLVEIRGLGGCTIEIGHNVKVTREKDVIRCLQ